MKKNSSRRPPKKQSTRGKSSPNKHDPRQVKFYVDESGNTGSDYFSSEQPFYVTSGTGFWGKDVVQEENLRLMKVLGLKDGQGEVKSSTMLKKQIFRFEMYRSIRNSISSAAVTTVFSIVEKKCMASWVLLRYLLDEDYTPGFNIPIENSDVYYEANQIIQRIMPEDILKKAIVSVHDGDNQSFIDVVAQVNQIISSSKEDIGILKYSLNHTKESLKNLFSYPEVMYSTAKKIIIPNHYAFLDLRNSIAAWCTAQGLNPTIIHDNQLAYEATFRGVNDYFGSYSDMRYLTSSLTNVPLMTGPASKVSLRFSDSKNNARLQFADWFTGALRYSIYRVWSSDAEPWESEEDRKFISFFLFLIKAKTFPLLHDMDVGGRCSLFVSQDLLSKIFKYAPQTIEECDP